MASKLTTRFELVTAFWKFVTKVPGLGPKGKCWEWVGYKDKDGYGLSNTARRLCGETRTHRAVYKLTHPRSKIAKVMVCHHCDNPPCCRPSHLFKGNNSLNMRDCVAKGRYVNNNLKLTSKQVMSIIRLLAQGLSAKKIACQMKVTAATVGHIKNGVTWSHLTGVLKRAK